MITLVGLKNFFFQGGLCNSEHEAERQRMRMTCAYPLYSHTNYFTSAAQHVSLASLRAQDMYVSQALL